MKRGVIHFYRKFHNPHTLFIRNQIVYHNKYLPSIVYAEKTESVFKNELEAKFNTYQAVKGIFGEFLYNKFRILTKSEHEKLQIFIKEKNPQILHVHYGVDCLVYSKTIKKLNIPTVVSFYGYDCTSFPKRFNGYGAKLLQKKVFNNSAVKKIFAMSSDMKLDLISIGCPEKKITVHYYGTETKLFNIKNENRDKKQIDFLIISSLDEKKGHQFLIKAFKKAQKLSKEKVHLHIVGDGPMKKSIENKISMACTKIITMHNPVEYGSTQHLEFLKMADVFVHPSITATNGDKEGIPGAIIEAMAAGLPVISTKHAGIPFIIKNKVTGFLTEENDIEALSNNIIMLAKNQNLRKKIGENAQKFAIEKLDIKEKEKELEAIYDEVISQTL